MASDTERSRRRRAVVILLLILLVAGVVVVILKPWDKPPRIQQPARDIELATNAAPAQPERPVVVRPTASLRAPEEEHPPAASQTPPEQPPDDRVVIQFQDGDGNPVPHLKFRYAMAYVPIDASTGRRMKFGPDAASWDVIADGPRNPFEADSDVNGRFELPSEHERDDGVMTAMRLELITANCAFARRGSPLRRGIEAGLQEQECIVFVGLKGVRVVTVLRTEQVTVSIQFSDGSPYEGSVALSPPMPAANFVQREMTAGQAVVFDKPSVQGKFRFGCLADRPGWRTGNSWSFESDEMPSYVRLVIPEDPDQCVVEVNLEKWTKAEPVEVLVYSGSGTSTSHGGLSAGGEVWRTIRLRGSGVFYVIQVRGESGLWQSEPFRLERKEARVFHAVPTPQFSVRARFVTAEGSPMPRGCIRSLESLYIQWERLRLRAGAVAIRFNNPFLVMSGADGVAELKGLPNGKIDIFLEGEGTEIERRTVVGKPGEVIDLGDIQLKPATGMIEITLLNRREGVTYWVWVHGPGATGNVRIDRGVMTDKHMVGPLPRRPYQLFLHADEGGDGGPIPNPVVEFDDDGIARLTVDVGQWLTKAEKDRQAAATGD